MKYKDLLFVYKENKILKCFYVALKLNGHVTLFSKQCLTGQIC